MSVRITAYAGLWGQAAAAFSARAELPERKHLKLMDRGVRLGVAAVGRALAARPGWSDVPPERRGLFVGARPVGAARDLAAALDAARSAGTVDVAAFGELGAPLIHPLWLVKGLSNNIPGYACAYWDLRGPVANRCEGRIGGLAAIVEAVRAVAEGRVDLAVAGGADAVAEPRPGLEAPVGEGAAFVVLERHGPGPRVDGWVRLDPHAADGPLVPGLGDLGAATGAVRVVQLLADGVDDAEVEVGDAIVQLRAGVRISPGER